MFTSMSPPAQTLPKLPAQMSRLDVLLDKLPQPPRDSSQSASAEHFLNPVICLAVLPCIPGSWGKRSFGPCFPLFDATGHRNLLGICSSMETIFKQLPGGDRKLRVGLC